MVLAFLIFQDTGRMASATSAAAILNSLVLAIFLVGIGLLILLQLNISRRNSAKADKGVTAAKPKKRVEKDDLVSQFPYMSREELREMIVRERAIKSAESASSQDCDVPPVENEEAEAPVESEPQPGPVTSAQSQSTGMQGAEAVSAEMSLLSNLALAAAKEGKEECSESPKPPHHNKVERSVLSNEIPEEFRRKSRRI